MAYKGGKRRLRIISSILLAAVVWYHCSITLFSHTHFIDGKQITHSHPYSGTADAPHHTHTAAQFTAIAILSLFTAILCGAAFTADSRSFSLRTTFKTGIRFIQQALLSLAELRGPPPCRSATV